MRFLLMIPWLLLVSFQSNAQITLQFSVNQNPSVLTVNAGSNKTITSGQQVALGGSPSVSGGTSPYTYSWTPALGLNQSNVANPSASPVISTVYTMTVTDGKGCSNSKSVTVTVNGVVSNTFNSYQSSVKFFPNPAKRTLYISSDLITEKKVQMQLFSAQGIQIYEEWLNTFNGVLDAQIHLPEGISGLCTIKLSGEELQVVKKILVE